MITITDHGSDLANAKSESDNVPSARHLSIRVDAECSDGESSGGGGGSMSSLPSVGLRSSTMGRHLDGGSSFSLPAASGLTSSQSASSSSTDLARLLSSARPDQTRHLSDNQLLGASLVAINQSASFYGNDDDDGGDYQKVPGTHGDSGANSSSHSSEGHLSSIYVETICVVDGSAAAKHIASSSSSSSNHNHQKINNNNKSSANNSSSNLCALSASKRNSVSTQYINSPAASPRSSSSTERGGLNLRTLLPKLNSLFSGSQRALNTACDNASSASSYSFKERKESTGSKL